MDIKVASLSNPPEAVWNNQVFHVRGIFVKDCVAKSLNRICDISFNMLRRVCHNNCEMVIDFNKMLDHLA